MFRLTVSRPVYLGVKHPSGDQDQVFITVGHLRVCSCGALSDARTGLSFTVVAGPCQRSHSWVQVSRDSWPYFTVWDSRLLQPGGPGSHIYIHQEQDGPVITPGTGLPFHHLLQLAGLWWRYFNVSPRGDHSTLTICLSACFHSFDTYQCPSTVVYVAIETDLNKPLHRTGHLHDASLTPQFWLSGITS
jgi:hypothetical protein